MFMQIDPEEVERHQAAHDLTAHEVNRLFDEMSDEHMRTLGTILESIAHGENPARTAAFFMGRLSAKREVRFKVCAACGLNHDDALKDLAGTAEAEHREYTPIGSEKILQAWELREMQEYNLDDVREADTKKLIKFYCLGCFTDYPTIEDRKLKEPGVEGCSGCQQKAKWG